jgi:hypothetical protein
VLARKEAKARQREQSWFRPPAEPALAAISQRLRPLLDGMGGEPSPPGGAPGLLELEPQRLGLRYLAWGVPGGGQPSVRIDLEAWQTKGPQVECSCRKAAHGDCALSRLAVEAALDRIHKPGDPLALELARGLLSPAWARSVRPLDAALLRAEAAPAAELPSLISFRLFLAGDAPSVRPYRHAPLKGGGWNRGTETSAFQLRAAGVAGFPNADAVLLLLDERGSYGSYGAARDDRGYLTFHVLELLAGHPHLYLSDAPTLPVKIGRGTAELHVTPEEDGALSVRPAVNGDFALGSLLAKRAQQSRFHALPDAGGRRCVLVKLEPGLQQILSAFAGEKVVFPADGLEELTRRLSVLDRHLPLKLLPALEGEAVAGDLRPLLRLTPQSDGSLGVHALVRPLAPGPVFDPGEGPARLAAFAGEKQVHAVREPAAESAHVRQRAGRAGVAARRRAQGPALRAGRTRPLHGPLRRAAREGRARR